MLQMSIFSFYVLFFVTAAYKNLIYIFVFDHNCFFNCSVHSFELCTSVCVQKWLLYIKCK